MLRLFLLSAVLGLTAPHPAGAEGLADFQRLKYGCFVHYVWAGDHGTLTLDRNGRPPGSLDELANAFDVAGFAQDMAAWEVEYVVFTAWHANINPLFPSETMKRWGLSRHFCTRDLLEEVITALNARGIRVLLYTHPRDGHDLRGEDRFKTGWGRGGHRADPDWAEFDYQKWNDFNNELYGELVQRYGDRILGLFLDEGSSAGDSHRVVDYPRLRRTIKNRHPHLVMVQNYYGTVYSCDVGEKEYHHWQEFANRDGGVWPAYRMPVGTCFATTWWAARPVGTNTVVFSAEDMFRYTVLQAGVNTDGGGVQWATGPYAGGGWETGVDETMRKVASYIRPIASSLKGVHASQAFPTQRGAALNSSARGVRSVEWGVATDAPDGSVTYVHVLTPPKGKTLRIGMPANGARFQSARLLTTSQPVGLQLDAAGYVLTLPEDAAWNPLNTVIRLEPDQKKP
jgi:hypothetical protein